MQELKMINEELALLEEKVKQLKARKKLLEKAERKQTYKANFTQMGLDETNYWQLWEFNQLSLADKEKHYPLFLSLSEREQTNYFFAVQKVEKKLKNKVFNYDDIIDMRFAPPEIDFSHVITFLPSVVRNGKKTVDRSCFQKLNDENKDMLLMNYDKTKKQVNRFEKKNKEKIKALKKFKIAIINAYDDSIVKMAK